ncbi:MAG: histidine phosphatase family protein, partial [Alphaproteobacteria bacterium]
MTLIAMIRHGPTPWNEAKRLQGQRDIPLSVKGRRTVEGWTLPSEFEEFAWFCSPLTRARQTAALLGLEPEIEPAIKEMEWGSWDGHTMPELRAKFGDI